VSEKPDPLSRSPLVGGETVCSRFDDCGRHVVMDEVSDREKMGKRVQRVGKVVLQRKGGALVAVNLRSTILSL
jgi:hypothetical protein